MMEKPSYPLSPYDRDGSLVEVGARARIVGVPDLTGMNITARPEAEAAFRHLLGTYKKVIGFDAYGNAEIFFKILRGEHRGLHSVAIEPYLLLVPRRQSKECEPGKIVKSAVG